MKLFIIRHGETFENTKGICQGQTEGQLSPSGLIQSKQVSEELSQQKIDLIYSSTLQRAVETADIIKQQHPDAAYRSNARLAERNLGSLQGLPFPENYNSYKAYPLAEPMEDLHLRVRSIIQEIITQNTYQNIVIVSHGITITTIMAVLQNVPVSQIENLPKVDNASITEYEIISKNAIRSIRTNYTNHLHVK